ncbi:zinc finger BED domain-containing protein RICESLEEPER 2-like [Lotus japonicus]|uniref:zinc finger BED domain-containing protein RICESLEEPER 2-like n=1 Tax=Lotus japonicus TaxID=34305 RepID=UPI00258A8E65|nr:zinc finger BED domain-containing protein RICESLEEPER 2-like [Lotus japonicus]
MEQPNQHLSSTPSPIDTQAAGPSNVTQPAGASIGGSQPTQGAETDIARADPVVLPPPPEVEGANPKKKRKPNASGPRTTASIWKHFTRLPENEVQDPTAACNYCGKRYLCDSKTHGTTNLNTHLKICIKYTYAISNDPSQTVLNLASGDLAATSLRFNVEACRKAVAMFVILDEHAFRAVEGEGFKFLCNQLQPQFTVPSRFTVARDCYLIYLDEKVRLRAFFRSNCSRVALTTDCWTSVQNLSYLVLTAHFVDNDWRYQKRIISFSTVPNHKGETIGKVVEEVLREWGLRNLSTITVDNASSNDVAVAHLKKRFKNMNGLVLDGQFFHMRCCAHILNLVVNDGLKDMSGCITSIRNAVRFVRSSTQRHDKFMECIEFSRISSKKLVCLDVPTRWNSTYLMLDAAEKFQVAFEKLEFEDPNYLESFGVAGPPTSADWDKARAFIRFLKFFYEATQMFSSSLHVSVHTTFHQLAVIYSELVQYCHSSNPTLSRMGMDMKLKYDKYWGSIANINHLLYFGVIFDPRYKLKYVRWCFSKMYNEDPNLIKELITSINENLSRMYDCYSAAHNEENRQDQGQSSHGPLGPLEGSTSGSKSAEIPTFLEMANAFQQHLEQESSFESKNELERYLDEACVKDNGKFELLVWWRQNSSRFPILSILVKDVLATPVSTVASESAFSTGGRVLDTYRSSLNPEVAEALICTQNWMRQSSNQPKELDVVDVFDQSEKVITEFRGLIISGRARRCAAGAGSSQSQPIQNVVLITIEGILIGALLLKSMCIYNCWLMESAPKRFPGNTITGYSLEAPMLVVYMDEMSLEGWKSLIECPKIHASLMVKIEECNLSYDYGSVT